MLLVMHSLLSLLSTCTNKPIESISLWFVMIWPNLNRQGMRSVTSHCMCLPPWNFPLASKAMFCFHVKATCESSSNLRKHLSVCSHMLVYWKRAWLLEPQTIEEGSGVVKKLQGLNFIYTLSCVNPFYGIVLGAQLVCTKSAELLVTFSDMEYRKKYFSHLVVLVTFGLAFYISFTFSGNVL